MAVDRVFVEWLDISGKFLRSANYVATPAAVAGFVGAVQAVSNAGVSIWTSGPATFPATVPVDQQYPSALDTAVLLYRTTALTTLRITIPAPQSSIFLADQLTVDPAAIAALTAAVVAALGDNMGNAALTFVQGVRASRRKDVE